MNEKVTAPSTAKRFSAEFTVNPGHAGAAREFIATASGLSKSAVKDAMTKGAVRLCRGRHCRVLRRATAPLKAGDKVQFHYDPAILALKAPPARCLADEGQYSLWCKPAGMLAQGSVWGDHCALLRQAETGFQPRREAYLVHRLDREAAGLMLIAHTRQAAAALSGLFRNNAIRKLYRVSVRGKPQDRGQIDLPLDGKSAQTSYTVTDYDPHQNVAVLEVEIQSGRRHQIRRHLAAIGHPVMGDPAYGHGNKTPDGLQLVAAALYFTCPLSGRPRSYRLAHLERGCASELV